MAHVFMYQPLQIDPESPVRTNHYIRADTPVSRDITTRIRDGEIGSIVVNRMCGSFKGSLHESMRKRVGYSP